MRQTVAAAVVGVLLVGGVVVVFGAPSPSAVPGIGGPDTPDDGSRFDIDGYVLNVTDVGHYQQIYYREPALMVRVDGKLQNATLTATIRDANGTLVNRTRFGSETERHIKTLTTAPVYLTDGVPLDDGPYTLVVRGNPTNETLYRETVSLSPTTATVENLTTETRHRTVAWIENCENREKRVLNVSFDVRNTGDVETRLWADVWVNGTQVGHGWQYPDPSQRDLFRYSTDAVGEWPAGEYPLTVRVSTYGNATVTWTNRTVSFDPVTTDPHCGDDPPKRVTPTWFPGLSP